jgi:enoyl-CoA hydratase/carnithine racemase
MSTGHLSLRHDGPVLVATLDSPPDQYLDAATVAALTDLVEGLRHDRAVRALVITGAGDNGWPLHYDIAEIAQGSQDVAVSLSPGAARAAYAAVRGLARIPGVGAGIDRSPARGILQVARMHATLGGLGRLDQVVVAAIGGSALAGAFELALACDLRIAAEGDFRYGLPETTVGFLPGGGGTQRLARLVGPAKAIELLLEAQPVDQGEALRLGLLTRTASPGQLLDEAVATAHRIASLAPGVVAGVKRAVYDGASRSLTRGLDVEAAQFMSAASTEQARGLLHAFVAETDPAGTPWTDPAKLSRWRPGGPSPAPPSP